MASVFQRQWAQAVWSHLQRPLLMADSGAPLGIGFLEPVVSKAQVLLLARRAAHPHAAALFIDWALSEEGQHLSGSISCAAR